MKNNSEIRFDCTTEQHDKIKSNADKVGMSIKEYLLQVGINTEIEIKIKVFNGKNSENSLKV